jgi:hypothetical protein
LTTGCQNFYSSTIVYNPNFDCTVGTNEASLFAFGISPNPASDAVQIRLNKNLSNGGTLRVWDAAGRLVRTSTLAAGTEIFTVECGDLSAGFFTLEILADGFRGVGKMTVVK